MRPLQHHDAGRGHAAGVPLRGAAAEPAATVQRGADPAGADRAARTGQWCSRAGAGALGPHPVLGQGIEKIGYKLINARAEGIDAKPSFREAFKRGRRCLIPADGFYEWAKDTKPKQPWRITLADGGPFAFAGLWERWDKAPDGVRVESCTIITTAANVLVAKLHDRMPVILPVDDYPAWLGEDSAAAAELLALLKPYRPDAMRAYPVSTVVNSPKNDGPECIEPVV